MAENTVIVSEINYDVVVDEQNNIAVEISVPSIGPAGYAGSVGYTGSAGYTGSVGFTGSQGNTGDVGYAGSQGYTGSVGFTGSTGQQGYTGSAGDIGYTGSVGASGYTGSVGFVGSQGPIGFTGSQGDIGFTGSQGTTGYTGSKGDAGYTGSVGSTGFTGSVGDVGFTGSAGYTGSKGDAGYTGSVGDVGFTGSAGYTGSKGDAGYTGSQGVQGLPGLPGNTGYTGSQGDVGFTGSQGVTGYTGSANWQNIAMLGFDTTAGYTGSQPGDLFWDSGNGTLALQLAGNNVTLQLGQEEVVRVFNSTASPMTGGQIVYVSGAQGNRPAVTLASATAEMSSSVTLGMVTEAIASGAEGFVTTSGMVNGLNTSAFAEGVPLWLSDTVPGAVTTTRPTAPSHAVLVGYVVRQHTHAGSIFVKIQNGYELNELHNVLLTSPTAGQVLGYNGSIWVNVTNPGYTGSVGYTGSQGDQGYTGSKGADGVIGYNGSIGYTGSAGYTGSQGPVGYTGSTSSPVITTPTYSGTVVADVSGLVDVVRITLTGNLQLGFTGAVDGQKFIVELTQDSVGGRTLTYDTSVRFGTDIVSTTLTTTANKTDKVGFIYNNASGKYDVIAFAKGY